MINLTIECVNLARVIPNPLYNPIQTNPSKAYFDDIEPYLYGTSIQFLLHNIGPLDVCGGDKKISSISPIEVQVTSSSQFIFFRVATT